MRPFLKCDASVRIRKITGSGGPGISIAKLTEEYRPIPGGRLEFIRYDPSSQKFELVRVVPR